MNDFFGVSETDLSVVEDLFFRADTAVEMICLEAKENPKRGGLILNCKVASGEHTGKQHTIYINDGDNEFAKKNKIAFMLAFWTKDQIIGRKCKHSDLMGRKFTVVPAAIRNVEGRKYQNFHSYHDLGLCDPSEEVQPAQEPTFGAPEQAATAAPAADGVPF